MLDKVGGKEFPVADIENQSGKVNVAVIAPQGASTAKRPLWLGILLAVIQAVLMVAVLFGSYMLAKRMIDDKPEARKRPAFKSVYTVETVTAKMTDYQPVFSSYGQIIAARTVDLRALVSGEIIRVNPKLRAGARIAKGDYLVEIDDFNYRGALAEAEANLLEAQSRVIENEAQIALEVSKRDSANEQLELAVADLTRVDSLKKRQAATLQQVEIRKLVVSQREQAVALAENTIKVQQARIEQLKASLLRLQWRVEQAQRNLESTTLVAPFSGIVRSSSAEIGRAITANDVVVSMYEADTMEVKFTLTDAQYGRLQSAREGLIGRKLEVIWSVGGSDWKYPAVIDRLGAEITSTRGGVELYALVGDASGVAAIRPGAFVEVRVPDRSFSNTIIVPDTAIYGTDTAYTVVNGKLVENKVAIVAYEGETALIGSGLKDGDEVLLTRITEVSAGLNVRKEGAMDAPPASRPSENGAAPRRGPPSPEEVSRVAKANDMTVEAFRALAQAKRRKLIGAHRAANK
jgi:RND family efflux transporter MFP subunit